MESTGKTLIKYSNNIKKDDKNKIITIFDDVYGKSVYIKKIDGLNYQGDMGCLCVLGTRIIRNLMKNNLISYLSCYDVINENTKEKESLLDEE